MNNDLISREALKEAIAEATYNFEQIPIRVDKLQEIIDNAPTVEAIPLDVYEKAMDIAIADLFKVQEELNRIRNEKKQGEWIGNAFNEHHCNICGHPALWEEEPDDYYEAQSRFCPNCGADMRGKEE